MKIILLKEAGIALPASEGSEALQGNKLAIKIVDERGREIEAKAKLCGKVFSSALSANNIEEGEHPLAIEYEHKQYPAAIITRRGSKVMVTSFGYQSIVKTAIASEKALGIARSFDERLKDLEKAYNGVDLTQLS